MEVDDDKSRLRSRTRSSSRTPRDKSGVRDEAVSLALWQKQTFTMLQITTQGLVSITIAFEAKLCRSWKRI